MLTREKKLSRGQLEMLSIEDMVLPPIICAGTSRSTLTSAASGRHVLL